MTFERFFRSISYAAVFCGFFSLWITGSLGVVESLAFLGVMVAAWFLEGSRWLISERIGTVLIVLALPAAYFSFKFGLFTIHGTEAVIAGILARMILLLSAIKLLQRKSDRDWVFLYLMSFFEVLLAAGMSISLLYLTSFLVYLLVMVCAVIAYEMRKTAREVEAKVAGEAMTRESGYSAPKFTLRLRKLPAAAAILIALIAIFAMPLFFLLPRVGGAGLGGFQSALSTSTGFSDSVRLGGIGRLQQNDAVVMRVKLDVGPASAGDLYFRGVALDTFDNRTWSRSKSNQKEPFVAGDRDLIQLDYASGKENLLVQTIYLEPLDTPVLFSVPRTIAVQGNFPVLYKDRYGAISFQPGGERSSYKVLSDTSLPTVERLRADNQGYSIESQNYLQLPVEYDQRIADLATTVAGRERSRYDKAVAIESYLRGTYGYTLEMRSGGPEPIADFLFNVKEGHCEYFASSMAVMLRTQGLATRIVNGFHQGEYNETAGMYVVRQRHAHAWVEVYFPKENVWVPFDPTPSSGDLSGMSTGIIARIGKYLEALDAIWIQYFVAFDNQEQRSLARTVRSGFVDYQTKTGSYLTRMQDTVAEWWSEVRGDSGPLASSAAVGYAIAVVIFVAVFFVLLIRLYRRLIASTLFRRLWERLRYRPSTTVVGFYERMQKILAEKGVVRPAHQTPLEFAHTIGIPEAVLLTEKYNRVRFGDQELNRAEDEEIRTWLDLLEAGDPDAASNFQGHDRGSIDQ